MNAATDAEYGVGETQQGDQERWPAKDGDKSVGTAEPERPAFQRQGQRMQNGKAGQRISGEKGGNDHFAEHRGQAAEKADHDGESADRESGERQFGGLEIRPRSIEPAGGLGNFRGQPEHKQ